MATDVINRITEKARQILSAAERSKSRGEASPPAQPALRLYGDRGLMVDSNETWHSRDLAEQGRKIQRWLAAQRDQTRLAMAAGPSGGYIATCFDLDGVLFFPAVEWPAARAPEGAARAALLNALDRFLVMARRSLTGFVQAATVVPPVDTRASEQGMLRRIAGLSERVECVAVLDDQGLVVDAAGDRGLAEGLAEDMAGFRRLTRQAFSALDATACRQVEWSDGNEAAGMAPIEGTPFAAVALARGSGADALVAFVLHVMGKALMAWAVQRGALWHEPVKPAAPCVRRRDSWFGHAKLIARSPFVGRAGSPLFHLPSCRLMARTPERRLRWFATRAEAMAGGRCGCRECRA